MGRDTESAEEQFELLPELARLRAEAQRATERTAAQERSPATQAAPELPVARVLVDLPLAHLDREFDYLVPASMHDDVVAGSRVKVRFAGQDVDGFVLERAAASEHPGRLQPLRRAVSAEPVLTPQVARLAGLVAARYAGTRSDVLRLAVPPRHARVEKEARRVAERPAPQPSDPAAWADYRGGPELLAALGRGGSPRAVWTCLPGEWAAPLAAAVAATLRSGRGSVVCVPDQRDLVRLDEALTTALGEGRHVVLTADLGPAPRYRSFLALSRGDVRVAIGTRAAAYAPVRELGLVALWDDGDDLLAEPRAPYPHTREVLLLRAHDESAAVVLGAHARSVEADALVESGWAVEVVADRATVRERTPRVTVTGATEHDLARDPWARSVRMPAEVHRTVGTALERGPVLVQTPRGGYAVSLACDACRAPARCPVCSGPLHQPRAHVPPSCRWCGTTTPEPFRCPECGGTGLRAPVLGERRTAEELGRAFPGAVVRRSSADRVLDEVAGEPAIVVATPGAEPRADGGYAAVVLLDTWLMLARPDLRTAEESLRRWLGAASLARPASLGGTVLVVGDPSLPVVQALVRWDPAGFARREAEERRAAHLPPASRLAVLTGDHSGLDEAVGRLRLPPGAEVLGPAPDPAADDGGTERVVVRVPRAHGATLSAALREMSAGRAARKQAPVRVQVDPWSLP